MNKLIRWAALMMLIPLLFLTGCQQFKNMIPSEAELTPVPVNLVTPTPMPEIQADPAEVIRGVETDIKAVALILEGYTDDSTMEAIAEALRSRRVPAIFFVSGVTADEHPELIGKISEMGFDIGNYGMSGTKRLQTRPAYQLAEWFTKTQELIYGVCGKKPKYIRCNGTTLTDNVLRAVTAAGLSAAVEPTAYLNHRSIRTREEADTYAASVLRGSILTIKLGQELDADEYGDAGEKLDERPAIDPSPGIRRDWMETEERFVPLPEMVGWLVDALRAAGYSFLSIEDLKKSEVTLVPKVRDLSEEEQAELNAKMYEKPVTTDPLFAGQSGPGTYHDLKGAVFVGDSVMRGIGEYVEWRQKSNPDYFAGVQFLTADNATVEYFLNDSADPIGDKLAEMGAKSVWICLGFSNVNGYRKESYLTNYRLLIYRIQEKNPGIRTVILTVPPRLDGYGGTGNAQFFQLNLMLCGMCRMYGLGFVDTAYPFRDENGALKEEYCLDAVTYGRHLNDVGCEMFLGYLLDHMPAR